MELFLINKFLDNPKMYEYLKQNSIWYKALNRDASLYKEFENKMKEYMTARNSKQPVNMPSAGSTFKRPAGFFAGKLIEDSGLKGYTIGGASVSTLHAGFIVNNGDATSKDILDLISYVQDKVYENYSVKLETEVKIIGED